MRLKVIIDSDELNREKHTGKVAKSQKYLNRTSWHRFLATLVLF